MKINDILNLKVANKYWRGRIVKISDKNPETYHLKKIGGKSRMVTHNPQVVYQFNEFWQV